MRLYDYPGSGNAYKIRLLFAQLEIAYERVEVEIFRGESRTAEFLRKNPSGQVPAVELDDGRCLGQSNAILWYFAQGTALLPDEPFSRAQVLQWLFFEQSDIEPNVGSARFWILTGRARDREPELARRLDLARGALASMDQVLAARPYFVGERYSIADIALYAYAHRAPDAGLALGPNVRAWVARVEGQPRFVSGPEPYSAAAKV
jgi:glutathione S-transferase